MKVEPESATDGCRDDIRNVGHRIVAFGAGERRKQKSWLQLVPVAVAAHAGESQNSSAMIWP